jgi:hypothetical protein
MKTMWRNSRSDRCRRGDLDHRCLGSSTGTVVPGELEIVALVKATSGQRMPASKMWWSELLRFGDSAGARFLFEATTDGYSGLYSLRSSTWSCPLLDPQPEDGPGALPGRESATLHEGPEHASHRSSGEDACGGTPRVRRQLYVPRRFCRALARQLGSANPRGNADYRGRRVESRGYRPVVACAARLPAGGALRRYGALLGRPALG